MQDHGHRGLNDKGVLDMPLRIMVIMVLIAITIPVIMNAVETNEDSMMERSMDDDIRRIKDAVGTVYRSGVGSSRCIDISLQPGCELVLGSGTQYEISVMYNGRELSREYMDNPAVGFSDMVILTGDTRISLLNTGGFVEVTVL